ncbi:MAG: TolC family protein, partial [Muribaculaceae bacterium]|nr:TolC family protein [Muribaculaceae bacterium]
EASHANYRQMLEIFIGTNLTHDKLERPDMNEPTCRVSARPELTLFDAQQRKLDAQRNMINTSVMPRFSAFAQGFYGYPGLDMFKSMMSSEWRLDGMIGVKMSWNIGAFYTKNNDIKKLDIKQQQIDIQRDVFLFNSNLQTSHEDSEIARLRKVIDNDDRIVELRHRVRIAAESQLTNGVIDTTELLKKISDETIAKLNKSSHEIELLQATYRLKNILNQ